jgi:hypothetical protein
MVVVPAGIFLQGGSGSENTPPHEAIVARFELDRAETTMAAYDACVRAGACAAPRTTNPFCNANFSDRADHPANCVDFRDAWSYCAFVGKRLPTEREWEYAARGGAEQRRYSWGDDEPTSARACYSHPGGSCRVGSFEPGAFGLLDMTGNVWEWTSTIYAPYPEEPRDPAPTPREHDARGSYATRVYRGGSWSRRFAKWMTNDLRNRYAEHEHSASVGIRCARDVQPLVCPPETEPRAAACVRTSGTPLCPPTEAFVEGACRPGGIVPAWDPKAPRAPASRATASGGDAIAAASTTASASTAASEPPVITLSRQPEVDEDCRRVFSNLPNGFVVRGGGFHDREPKVRASGCKKRDTSVGWTSLCCP